MKKYVFCPCIFAAVSNFAYGHEPTALNVSLDASPFVYYQGSISSGQEIDVFTQVSHQDFLITTAIQSSLNCDLYQNNTLIVNGKAGPMASNSHGTLFLGNGILRIEAGSTLKVKAVGDDCTFFLSGYHIEIGSPYQTMTGSVNHSSTQTVYSFGSGEDFVIRSVIMGGNQPETCDLYIDGTLLVEGNLRAMTRENVHSAFTSGNIRIPVPKNSSLMLKNTGSSAQCHYYIEGSYIK